MKDEFAETRSIVERADPEERQKVLAECFMAHWKRLRLFIDLRMDRRLCGVVAPSDVLQETFLVASKRLGEYSNDPKVPLFLWLRLLAGQKLHELYDQHFGVQKRDARRTVSLDAGVIPGASSVALAERLVHEAASPSELAMQSEKRERVKQAIDAMDPMDREILALRFYESLSSAEAARALSIKEETARKRYLRSMKRLKELLTSSADDPSQAWRE